MPLSLTAKKLYLLDFCELVRLVFMNQATRSQVDIQKGRSRAQSIHPLPTTACNSHHMIPCRFVRPSCVSPRLTQARPSTLTNMAQSTLAERFQAVTTQKNTVEFMKMSYKQLAKQRISFGEAKLGQRFQDPKYTAWFVKKYETSQKHAHHAFLHYINLCGASRASVRSRSPGSARPTRVESQGQSSAPRHAGRSQPGELVGRGGVQALECGPRRDLPDYQRRDAPPERPDREHGDCAPADHSPTPSSDTDRPC